MHPTWDHFLMKYSALFLLCLLLFGCNNGTWKVEQIPSPAGQGSGEPYLAASPNAVWMSWLEKTPAGHSLKLSKWDGKWSPARAIVTDVPFFVNWADFPSILSLSDNQFVAHWLEKKGEG